jgi:Tfp pilus assembly protein PilZ
VSKERNGRVQEFGYRVPRFPADFQLLLQTGDPEPRVLEARCTDISADGLAVRMSERLSVGTQVTLVLTLPGSSTSLRIAGRVIYQKNDEHGLTFVFSSPQERESVGKHLSSVTLRTLGSRRPPG